MRTIGKGLSHGSHVIWAIARRNWNILALVLSAALLFVLSYRAQDLPWFRDLLLGLGTNVTVAIVIVFMVEGTIRRREARELARRGHAAVRLLRQPLSEHLYFLLNLWHASAGRNPTTVPTGVTALQGEEFLAAVRMIDFSAPSPVLPAQAWAGYAKREADGLSNAITSVLDRHSTWVSQDVVDLLESVLASRFLEVCRVTFLLHLAAARRENDDEHLAPFLHRSIHSILLTHMTYVARLVRTVDQAGGSSPLQLPTSIWNEPEPVGSGRLAIGSKVRVVLVGSDGRLTHMPCDLT